MTVAVDEGDDFLELAASKFGANTDKVEQRETRDHRSGLTSKQRAKRAIRTEKVNFRVSPEVKASLVKLAADRDESMSDVFEHAILELAKKGG